jgi:hypothetical protein
VYRRADLSRTMTLVVALLSTAVSAGASACEFRSNAMGKRADEASVAIVTDVAMAGIHARAERDPAISPPIERIRRVE